MQRHRPLSGESRDATSQGCLPDRVEASSERRTSAAHPTGSPLLRIWFDDIVDTHAVDAP
jgi:hypothetical protein